MFFRVCLLSTICISSVQNCGRTISTKHRIIGGESIRDVLYPWYAAFGPKHNIRAILTPFCGGSLITKKSVLSAAHCIDAIDDFKKHVAIYFGITDLIHHWRKAQKVPIGDYTLHPLYKTNVSWYDIGIVTLATEINNEPICFPPPSISLPKSAQVIGFGTIGYNNIIRMSHKSPYLQHANILVYDKNVCEELQIYSSLEDGVFCAGDLTGERDSCNGDSGGPLQYKDENGKFTLFGIVSFGFGCANINHLGVYTDVRHFRDWILSNLTGKVDTKYDLLEKDFN